MFATSSEMLMCLLLEYQTWKYEFFLTLFFATDEINRNFCLLPNMSLLFSFPTAMCFDTLEVINQLTSLQNNVSKILNYDYGISMCVVELTGP